MDEDVYDTESGLHSVHLRLSAGRRRDQIDKQASLPMAWKAFTPTGRLKPSSNRDRLVDVCEELVKLSTILRPYDDLLSSRFSERQERREKGRLMSQAEKDAEQESLKVKIRQTGDPTL
jgi:arsenic resistance protein ArsH